MFRSTYFALYLEFNCQIYMYVVNFYILGEYLTFVLGQKGVKDHLKFCIDAEAHEETILLYSIVNGRGLLRN